MRKLAINGKFLFRRHTGVERYCLEIVKSLDTFVKPGEAELIIPKGMKRDLILKNIEIVEYGKSRSLVFWEHVILGMYLVAHNRLGLSLGNTAPLFSRNCIVALHDVNSKVNPQFFPMITRIWIRLKCWNACKSAKHLITVSRFSKMEITRNYNVKAECVSVIYPAWQHYQKTGTDPAIFDKLNLAANSYFLAVGSVIRNKNFLWIDMVAKNNPDKLFVIAGRRAKRFGSERFTSPNLLYAGFLTDPEIKALMANCKAFLFPSLYEGFGLPPLEALSVGANVICSNASCLPEIYADSVHYIDPNRYDYDLDEVLNSAVSAPSCTLEKYSWEKSAKAVYELVKRMDG
jgi:glycosyltransferase involved in cell wall biosynthesis